MACILIEESFYSTYEELKHSLASKNFPPEMSFYSTYEELKPSNKEFYRGVSVCFYSTYEELKHVTAEMLEPITSVFTVPMRNWNYHMLHLKLWI